MFENITTENFESKIKLINDTDLCLIKTELYKIYKLITEKKIGISDVQNKISKGFKYIVSSNNISSILSYPPYCGRLIIDAKQKKKAFYYDEDGETMVFNEELFIKCTSMDRLIDFDTWCKAAKHIFKSQSDSTTEENYLLKGVLKCGKCHKVLRLYEGETNYHCINNCTSLTFQEILETVAEKMVEDNIALKLNDEIEKHIKLNDSEIKDAEEKISRLKTYLFDTATKYSNSPKENLVTDINTRIIDLTSLKSSLNSMLEKRNLYNEITNLFIKNNSKDRLINILTGFFLEDERKVEFLFKQVIKEVKFFDRRPENTYRV